MQGTAVEVSHGLERGEAAETIVLELEQRYEAADGEIERSREESLLEDFLAAELVVAEGNGTGTVAPASAQGVGERVPFVPPSFTTFTDMQDIILLDPVHEVDTRGWPHASADASTGA